VGPVRLAAPKSEDHENDQGQGDPQGFENLVDALRDGARGVERDGVVQIARETWFHFRHELADLIGVIERVGAGQLIDGQNRRRLSVQASANVVKLRAQLDARDVLEPHHRAVRVLAQDDLAKLLLRG
jgi:hypothetical protein